MVLVVLESKLNHRSAVCLTERKTGKDKAKKIPPVVGTKDWLEGLSHL